jgi:hypothetical protein
LTALRGVGDASRGQWDEWTGYAFHIRRRLTAQEQLLVGEVIDYRGTPEFDRRLQLAFPHLPPPVRTLAQKENAS